MPQDDTGMYTPEMLQSIYQSTDPNAEIPELRMREPQLIAMLTALSEEIIQKKYIGHRDFSDSTAHEELVRTKTAVELAMWIGFLLGEKCNKNIHADQLSAMFTMSTTDGEEEECQDSGAETEEE